MLLQPARRETGSQGVWRSGTKLTHGPARSLSLSGETGRLFENGCASVFVSACTHVCMHVHVLACPCVDANSLAKLGKSSLPLPATAPRTKVFYFFHPSCHHQIIAALL